jgi:hypothetical protein
MQLLKITDRAVFYLANSIGPKVPSSPIIVVLMAFSTKKAIKIYKCHRLLALYPAGGVSPGEF